MKNDWLFKKISKVSVFIFLAVLGFSAFLPSVALSQEVVITAKTISPYPNTVMEYYVDGKLVDTQKYSGAQLISETGTFPDGLLKTFFPSGKLQSEYHTKNGKPEGVMKTYYEDGHLQTLSPYQNGKMNGLVKTYLENGTLSNEAIFVDGQMNEVKGYFPDGHLQGVTPMIGGVREGVCKTYFEDGHLESEQPCVGGKLNGVMKMYYDDGCLKSETPYQDNVLDFQNIKTYEDSGDCIKVDSSLNVSVSYTESVDNIAAFKKVVKKYHSLNPRPKLTGEARKFAVQAQDAISRKQYEKAIDLYKQALDISPWWPQGHYNRAELLGESNGYEEAIAEMKKYLLLEPKAKDAQAAQDEISKWEGREGN